MKFIDKDTGAEYEEYRLVSPSGIPNGYKVIRPVKVEHKYSVHLRGAISELSIDIFPSYYISDDEAQLIKEAVELSMDWLNRRPDHVFPESSWNKVKDAMKGDK